MYNAHVLMNTFLQEKEGELTLSGSAFVLSFVSFFPVQVG